MIRTNSFSAAGGRAVNEDAFVLQPLPNGEGWLVALADGQGGRAGGARAAQLACEVAAHAQSLTEVDTAVAADPQAGFTTLVTLRVEGDSVTGASCGDSAALAIDGSGTVAELTRHQLKNPPVGFGDATFIPFAVELVRPWKLLVITDGVWKYASWEKVRELGSRYSGEVLLRELQAAARLPNGEFQDDFTVVLLESE